MKKEEKGITLISLVVTIIILLILAGVSIATLTGPNGLITRANEAKKETEQAGEEKLKKIAQMEASTHLEGYEYKDLNGKKVTIPQRCTVSKIKGESTVEDGLVIIDSNGNEWVWIEVPKTIDIYKTAGLAITTFTDNEYIKIYEDLVNYSKTYSDSDNKGTRPGTDEWYEGCGLEFTEYAQLKKKMLKSIYQKEGFYIGRYEVGIKEENTVRYYGKDYKNEHPTNETPVIQKNKVVYNWVTNAQVEKLAVTGKTSSLMFGVQWDLVLKYIENKEEHTNDGTNTLINQILIKSDSTKCTEPKKLDTF